MVGFACNQISGSNFEVIDARGCAYVKGNILLLLGLTGIRWLITFGLGCFAKMILIWCVFWANITDSYIQRNVR